MICPDPTCATCQKIESLNKYGEKYCILPSCSSLAGHDGYYCEEHHSKYYFGKTDIPQREEEMQCDCGGSVHGDHGVVKG